MNPWLIGVAAIATLYVGAKVVAGDSILPASEPGGTSTAPDLAAYLTPAGAAGPNRGKAAGSVTGERSGLFSTYMPFNPNVQISPRVRASRSDASIDDFAAWLSGGTGASAGTDNWLSAFLNGLGGMFNQPFVPATVTPPVIDTTTGPYIPGYTPITDSNAPVPRTSDERFAPVVNVVDGTGGQVPVVTLRPGDFRGVTDPGFVSVYEEDVRYGGVTMYPEYNNNIPAAVRDVEYSIPVEM